MSDEIRVSVVNRGRKYLYMRYIDPLSGRPVERSTGCQRRKEANKVAARWEGELREGRYRAPSKITWGDFRQRYETEVLQARAEGTEEIVCGVFNTIERHLDLQKLSALTAERISFVQRKLREAGRSEDTIEKHMAHLKAALNWAKRQGMLAEVPAIEMPRRAKSSKVMKGRPITAEEFERMLDKLPEALHFRIGPGGVRKPSAEAVESWRHLLLGLWWSGLRLDEALHLWWDDRPDKLSVDWSGKYVMLRIPADLEKGHRDRLYPVAPEFAELIEAVPEAERCGPVFRPAPLQPNRSQRLGEQQVGRKITEVGKAAAVKVNTDPKTGKVKYASA